jgi:hypothetical protein
MLILAFDTATDVATSALVRDGALLGERTGAARTLLEDVDELLAGSRVSATALAASRARASASPTHAASVSPSRFPARASRRSTRSRPGSRARTR